LNATVHQTRDTIRRCERLLNLQDQYIERIGSSKKRARMTKLVHRLFDDPFIGISELSSEWKVYYQTAQSYLEELESQGILKELPNHQPRTFYAPEIWAVAYEDLGSIEQ
jgi:Fic family protein